MIVKGFKVIADSTADIPPITKIGAYEYSAERNEENTYYFINTNKQLFDLILKYKSSNFLGQSPNTL